MNSYEEKALTDRRDSFYLCINISISPLESDREGKKYVALQKPVHINSSKHLPLCMQQGSVGSRRTYVEEE